MYKVWVLLGVINGLACGGGKGKYPGTLGAPCDKAADCNSGLACSKEMEQGESSGYEFCTKTCDTADVASCPDGSFCGYASLPTAVCLRECTDEKFCEDLHPGADACRAFSGSPAGKKSCGIKG